MTMALRLAGFHGYTMIMCKFHTLNVLRTYLPRKLAAPFSSCAHQSEENVLFRCPLCTFQQPLPSSPHLRQHFKTMTQWQVQTMIVTIAQL